MGHLCDSRGSSPPGPVYWRGPKVASREGAASQQDACGNEPEARATTKELLQLGPSPLALLVAAAACLLLPTGWRGAVTGERDTLPQRILFEAPGRPVEGAPPVEELRTPALRGCCGAPTEFRWIFLDDSQEAVAGRPFRTRLLARDALGRQARPADCGALRVDLGLTGRAHLSMATSPQAWRMSELELYIENEHAEVVEAEVRIESPNPAADVLLQSSRIRFASGPPHNFVFRVLRHSGSSTSQELPASSSWPARTALEIVVQTQDRFGNRALVWPSELGGGRLALRSDAGAGLLEITPAGGIISFGQGGEGRASIQGLRAGSASLWLEQVGGNATAKQRLELKTRTSRTLTFVSPATSNSPSAVAEAARASAKPADQRWTRRAVEVREAFLHAWNGYRSYAWGRDELQPISRSGKNTFGGIGMTIVDSLTTLWLMGLDEDFEQAFKFVRDELDFDRADMQVSTFELVIRGLGGLLGAHALSGRQVFLDRARELGGRLLPALNTTSKLPWPKWNIARGFGEASGEPTILAEAGSLQLEFRYLAAQTGEQRFRQAADDAFEAVQSAGIVGVMPVYLTPPAQLPVKAVSSKFAFGALADSYYEYLLKQWLQSPSEVRFKDLWLRVMDELPHLVRPEIPSKPETRKVPHYKLLEVAPRGEMVFKMDHLSCFAPAMIALGLRTLPTEDLAQGSRNQTLWRLAEGLTASCVDMWTMTKSGLAPEFAFVRPGEPFNFNQVPPDGRHSFLRPETAESLFYLYRFTGDEKYRRWGEKLFLAISEHAKVDAGFASVQDVTTVPTVKIDEMQSFVMAETFKYLYLLFSPAGMLDLEQFVLNTEGHPLPRASS